MKNYDAMNNAQLAAELSELTDLNWISEKSFLHWLDTEVLPALVGPNGGEVDWIKCSDHKVKLWEKQYKLSESEPSDRHIDLGRRLAILLIKSGCKRKDAGPYKYIAGSTLSGPGIEGWPDGKSSADILNIAYAEGVRAGKEANAKI